MEMMEPSWKVSGEMSRNEMNEVWCCGGGGGGGREGGWIISTFYGVLSPLLGYINFSFFL